VRSPVDWMSLAAKLKVGGEAGRIGVLTAAERIGLRNDAAIPGSAEDLTQEWLTGVLCADHPGVRVTSVKLGQVNDGTTSRRPFAVAYEPSDTQADGLPTRLFAKFTERFTSRLLLGPVGAVRNEAEFYRRVQSSLPDLQAPEGYHVTYDERSWRSMFVLEDVGATRSATFCDAKTHIDRGAAESMMRNLAALHGAFWEPPDLAVTHPWLSTFERMQLRFNEVGSFEKRTLVGFDRSRSLMPESLLERRRELYPAAMASMRLNARGPQTFLHNDTHSGNWFRTIDGEMGLYDWQATVRGCWASDVAYALSGALTIEDRRAWERELIEFYLAELGRKVDRPPVFDDAWLAYRQQIFHAVIYWLFTIGEGRFQPAMQPRDLCEINVERMTRALVDLECFQALAERA
jgi:aminoglycoside phosphotransferase (APT) family kinase protein